MGLGERDVVAETGEWNGHLWEQWLPEEMLVQGMEQRCVRDTQEARGRLSRHQRGSRSRPHNVTSES